MASRKKIKAGNSSVLWITGSIFVLLVIVAFFIYFLDSLNDPNRYDYWGKNGVFHIEKEIVQGIDIYYVHVYSDGMKYIYSFRNHPEDLEDVYLEPDLISKLNRPEGIRELYVTRSLELGNETRYYDIIATAPLVQILGTGTAGLYKQNLINSYTVYINPDVAKATCSDVDEDTAVIWVGLTESTRVISTSDECIIIEGENTEELIKAAEKFAYYLLGVF